MGLFSYDYFKNMLPPDVYLAYPDKRTIGALHAHNLQTDIMGNSPDTGTFTVYRYEDDVETRFYQELEIGKYIQLSGIGWFRITEVSVINEGSNEYKEITILSLECELGQTYLTSFGSLGTDDDEQGGLDRYCLYNPMDVDHSVMHIVLEKNPGWSIHYIDPLISTEYRNFQQDSIDSYSFLTGTVAEMFECIFQFDSYSRSISAYKLESLGRNTGIFLNYRNVIKSIRMSTSEDNIKTVLTVIGGNDDRTNTPLGIVDVNITGTNQIYNFSYFHHMMSQELRDGLKHFSDLCKANETRYQEKMSSLLSHYDALNTLKNKVPDKDSSGDWTQYGLAELQKESLSYWDKMKTLLDSEDEKRKEYNKIRQAIEAEIAVRKAQIEQKSAEITEVIAEINALTVSLEQVLGVTLYEELGPFIREDTLTDDSFIVTNSMTDHEILTMQQALLEHGRSELKKICSPQFTLDIDLLNYTVDYDYKRFTDALQMFNIIHIIFDDRDSVISARLLKMHINWDDPSDFKVTFSNRNSLKETWGLIEEIRSQADDVSSKVEFATGAWKNAAAVSVDVNKYMNQILNAANQQLTSNDNNEILISKVGIQCRKFLPEQAIYDPAQIWITNNVIAITQDDWNNVGLAIGHVKMGNDYFFGVCADTLVGRAILGGQFLISNESGEFTIDQNGFTAKQGGYEVKINPDTPDNIFSISIDSKKLLYVDTTAKALTFEGKLISKSGQIASFNIADNTLTSGNIGLCSDTAAGAVAFWAGNTAKANAPFRVTNTGALVCSNATITGGSFKVGSNFSVNSSGLLKASGAEVSGTITATGGRIGGWEIKGNTLNGTSGSSYIRGGEINIGDGFFRVRDDEIKLGDFLMTYTTRGLFMSADEYSGFSAYTSSKRFAIWAAYNGNGDSDIDNYGFAVSGSGQLYAKEIYLTGDHWWNNWSLTKTLKQVYERIENLENAI